MKALVLSFSMILIHLSIIWRRKEMKILFLFSESKRNDLFKTDKQKPFVSNDQIPLGPSYISAVLKQHGHETDVFVLVPTTTKNTVYRVIKAYQPDMLAFSLVYREYDRIVALAKEIKRDFPEIFQLCGGVHVTLHPEELERQSFDAICVGEGEFAVLELVNLLEKQQPILDIPNIWVRVNGKTHQSSQRPFFHELDTLPYPDRDMWIPFISDHHTPFSILLGRGCPYNCTYCCNHALKRTAPGCYLRFRKPREIIKELDYLIRKYPENDVVYFEVEAINSDEEFLKLFLDELIIFNKTLSRSIHYGTNIRLQKGQAWDNTFKKMRKANFGFINIGLESGSNRVRKEIMKRDYDNEDVLNACMAARKNRIITLLYAMIGLPTETINEYEQTVEMIRKCRPNIIHMGIFYPYPGTDLYEICEEMGMLSNLKHDFGRNYASLNSKQFPRRRIQKE
jgi:radical SAM superfamily enzyme YgiQ (UPF0313 family)